MKTAKRFLLAFVLLAFHLHAEAQNIAARKAKITDSGQLWSTSTPEEGPLVGCVGKELAEDVKKYAYETNWPKGISTLEGRNKVRPLINDYKVYIICEMPSSYILLVPQQENGGMPADMRLERDFYFVIGKGGVEAGESVSLQLKVAQPSATASQQLPQDELWASITDPMQIISNPKLGNDKTFMSIVEGELEAEVIEGIVELSDEKRWPAGIANFTARGNNRSKMKDYKAIWVTDFDDMTLLYINPDYNKHMPADMQPPESGIFFVLKSTGVSKEFSATQSVEKGSVPAYTPGDFESELSAIISDYRYNFENIKGEMRKKDEDGLFAGIEDDEFDSKIKLTGLEDSKVRRSFIGKAQSFQARVGEFADKGEADEQFARVVAQINEMKLPFGTAVSDDKDMDNVKYNIWMPFDLSGKMDPKYKDIIVEVQMMKFPHFDENYKLSDRYTVMLSVFRQN